MFAALPFLLSLVSAVPVRGLPGSFADPELVVRSQLPAAPSGFVPQVLAVLPDELVQLTIALPQSNISGLHGALLEVSNPDHPNYGKHLSKVEVRCSRHLLARRTCTHHACLLRYSGSSLLPLTASGLSRSGLTPTASGRRERPRLATCYTSEFQPRKQTPCLARTSRCTCTKKRTLRCCAPFHMRYLGICTNISTTYILQHSACVCAAQVGLLSVSRLTVFARQVHTPYEATDISLD